MIMRKNTAVLVEQGALADLRSAADMQAWLIRHAAALSASSETTDTYALIHAVHAVRFIALTGRDFNTAPDLVLGPGLVQEIRVFAKSGELHLWRAGTEFHWRVLLDSSIPDDQDHFHVDSRYYLWGNHLAGDGCTLVDRDRGMSIVLPVAGTPNSRAHATCTVRNYLCYDDDGRVQVLDSRLVSLAVETH